MMFPKTSLKTLFPSLNFSKVAIPDMSVSGSFFEDDPQHENLNVAAKRLKLFQSQNPNALLANGYLEQRVFYNTPNFERIINDKKEYRNIHLGTDFWVDAGTPIHCPFDGEIVIAHLNNIHKDYGPLLVVKHLFNEITFYTLYGHLSINSLSISPKGKLLKQGQLLGYIGNEEENGHWVPHLHLQLITDLLGETKNYNGVAYPSEIEKWKELCPNPALLFKQNF